MYPLSGGRRGIRLFGTVKAFDKLQIHFLPRHRQVFRVP